jgi:hypothetical protein
MLACGTRAVWDQDSVGPGQCGTRAGQVEGRTGLAAELSCEQCPVVGMSWLKNAWEQSRGGLVWAGEPYSWEQGSRACPFGTLTWGS